MKYKVKHLGLIPDGGRRWAKREAKSLRDSYDITMRSLLLVIERFFEHGGESVSIYLFSIDNFKRPASEVADALESETEFLRELVTLQSTWNHNIVIAGKQELLPSPMTDFASAIQNVTGRRRTTFLCLAYDPLEELAAATPIMAAYPGIILTDALWVNQSIDLVVRSGGATTLSKFLPLQTAHARLIFLRKLFNDLTADDIMAQVREHEASDLLYGE